jgi:hypothetical protein
MHLQQFPAAIFNISCFVMIKPRRPDKTFYGFDRCTAKVSRRLQVIEQYPCHPVNLFVGALS